MNEIEVMKAEQVRTQIRGIIAREMGYANQSKVCQSAEMVFKYLGTLNQTEFRLVKKLLNGETVKGGKVCVAKCLVKDNNDYDYWYCKSCDNNPYKLE